MTLQELNRPEPAKRLPKTAVLMASITAAIALVALSAEMLLSSGSSQPVGHPTALDIGPSGGDVIVAALGCLFLLIVWLAIRSRHD